MSYDYLKDTLEFRKFMDGLIKPRPKSMANYRPYSPYMAQLLHEQEPQPAVKKKRPTK